MVNKYQISVCNKFSLIKLFNSNQLNIMSTIILYWINIQHTWGVSVIDKLVVTLLIESQYWVTELIFLVIETLARIELLEFAYWNIDWNWINLSTWIYYTEILDTDSTSAYASDIYHAKQFKESCVQKNLW